MISESSLLIRGWLFNCEASGEPHAERGAVAEIQDIAEKSRNFREAPTAALPHYHPMDPLFSFDSRLLMWAKEGVPGCRGAPVIRIFIWVRGK